MLHISNMAGDYYLNLAREELLMLSDDAWDRYDNPFEQKYVLKKPYPKKIQTLFLVDPVFSADFIDSHFTAVFKYVPGDYLMLHRDAEISPVTHKQKTETHLLYLSTDDCVGSPLEFWHDLECISRVNADFGTFVSFTNTGIHSVHGNPYPVQQGIRFAITVSMATGNVISNGRERAFFIPRPGDNWSEETLALRDKRASSDKYAEVYQV